MCSATPAPIVEVARDHDQTQTQIEHHLRDLRRWRLTGGDPEELGPWPEPEASDGTQLPRLAFRSASLRALLEQGHTATEIHRAVHGFGQLVIAGALPVEKWRAPYVFAGFFDGLVVEVRKLAARRARETTSTEVEAKPEYEPPSEELIAFMESSTQRFGQVIRGDS